MARIKLSPPWSIFYDEIRVMFAEDPEVRVIMDEENKTVHVFVSDPRKSAAIRQILQQERQFGRVKLTVLVPPPDSADYNFADGVELYCAAFEKNPRLSYVQPKTSIFDTSFYVVFKNEVIQYFNDDISDINGQCSTLAECIARDIFVGDNLPNFNTDFPAPPPNCK